MKLDEVVARIIEIQGLISDGRTALIDVQEQLLEKNREIFKLEQACTKLTERLEKKQLERVHHRAAWKVLDDGTEEGPDCPNCWEATGNFMQPGQGISGDDTLLHFHCGQHGADLFRFYVPVELCGDNSIRMKSPQPTKYRMDFPRR